MATERQIEFLTNLGYPNGGILSVEDASDKIDELLKQEKETGVSLSCPYCSGLIDKRPMQSEECPHCNEKMHHVCGQLYTEEEWYSRKIREETEAENREQQKQEKWFRKQRELATDQIAFCVKAERDYGGSLYLGFKIMVGEECERASSLHHAFLPFDVAIEKPELLPPYPGICRHDECACEFEDVSKGERKPTGLTLSTSTDTPGVTAISQPSGQQPVNGTAPDSEQQGPTLDENTDTASSIFFAPLGNLVARLFRSGLWLLTNLFCMGRWIALRVGKLFIRSFTVGNRLLVRLAQGDRLLLIMYRVVAIVVLLLTLLVVVQFLG